MWLTIYTLVHILTAEHLYNLVVSCIPATCSSLTCISDGHTCKTLTWLSCCARVLIYVTSPILPVVLQTTSTLPLPCLVSTYDGQPSIYMYSCNIWDPQGTEAYSTHYTGRVCPPPLPSCPHLLCLLCMMPGANKPMMLNDCQFSMFKHSCISANISSALLNTLIWSNVIFQLYCF